MNATQDNNRSRQGRIPATLQAVFLASNRGKEVNKPPPAAVASKVFFRNWLFQRQTGARKEKAGLFAKKNKKSKRSKNQPQKPILQERVAQTPKVKAPISVLTPQVYMDAMIRFQGYSTVRFESLSSAYYNKPSPLQLASYNVHLIEVIRGLDFETLTAAMEVGLSPNPCNAYAESIAHMVSRRGNAKGLQILMDHGCNLQIADDYGRTPLHDCCWAADPAFEVADIILAIDPRMFYMTDKRGALPLSYVRQEHWSDWIEYLESKKDIFWPKRNVDVDGDQEAPALTLLEANSIPMPDPKNALTAEMAAMVASGRMTAEEAKFLKYDKDDETCDSSDEDSDGDYDSDDSEYDSDEDEDE